MCSGAFVHCAKWLVNLTPDLLIWQFSHQIWGEKMKMKSLNFLNRLPLTNLSSRHCQTLDDDVHQFPDLVMVHERAKPVPSSSIANRNSVANRTSTSSLSTGTAKTMSVPLIINTEFIDDETSTIDQTLDKGQDSEDYSLSEGSLRSR